MILTLIRHGQTEGSLRDLYYGAADIPVLPAPASVPAHDLPDSLICRN